MNHRQTITPHPITPYPITLVIGGARSGKSRHAEALVEGLAAPPWHYVATATAGDAEMADRIARHRADRRPGWVTHEEPLQLADLLARLAGPQPVLVDCLTLWLANVMLGGEPLDHHTARLHLALQARGSPLVVVSNEVGLSIVPDNELARRFRDEAGRLNQRVAAAADKVVMTIAGLPLVLKPAAGDRHA